MPRFFVDNVNSDKVILTGENARHIGRSLRMKVGDVLTLCCEGTDYECSISAFTDSEVCCDVVSSRKTESEPETKLTLFQAMPKGDKAETIVQKAVELGAYEVVFVMTARCVSRPDEKSFAKRLERLNKVSLEAAKQCGRGIIPRVSGIISLSELTGRLSSFDKALMCYEKGGASLSDAGISRGQRIALFIGSEGGFEQAEADAFVSAGGELTGLGARILRCETAPVAAASIIMHLAGEM
ncbi:RsmE family RNA methyltransferase [Ruminococcus sp. NK3A76]|uniref:RsmE family RNA methyltransferase n=1 Tax=Ruminococcus sp. NK3A76 TaxID=877411 RepID=UPI000490FD22|nr:RsmE family RNA methyltransferase [Ruminococcus sp. NK3A76]